MELREFGCKLCKERFKRPWHLTRHHQLIHEKQSNNVKNLKSEASRSSTESFSSPLIQSPETSSNNSQQNITNNNQSIGSNSHNSSSLVTVKEEPDLSSVLSDPAISNNDICTNNSFENSIQPQSQNNQNDAVVNANPSANIDSFNKILNNNSIESSSPLDFIGTSDNNFSLDQQSFANVNETTATSTNYINAQQPQTPQPYYPSAVAASANSAMQWDMANYDSNKNYQMSESPYTNYNSADYSSLSTTYQSNVAMVSKLWMRILSVSKFALKISLFYYLCRPQVRGTTSIRLEIQWAINNRHNIINNTIAIKCKTISPPPLRWHHQVKIPAKWEAIGITTAPSRIIRIRRLPNSSRYNRVPKIIIALINNIQQIHRPLHRQFIIMVLKTITTTQHFIRQLILRH